MDGELLVVTVSRESAIETDIVTQRLACHRNAHLESVILAVVYVCAVRQRHLILTEPCRSRSAPLVKGTVSPLRDVPAHIKRPPYVGLSSPPFNNTYQKHDEKVLPHCCISGARRFLRTGRCLRQCHRTVDAERFALPAGLVPQGIAKMEAAGKLAAEVLEKAGKMVKARRHTA